MNAHKPSIAAAALSPAQQGDQQPASRGALASLTYVYRFAGYFQREPLAVFDNGQDAIDFAMAYNKARTADGYITKGCHVGPYRGDKPSGWFRGSILDLPVTRNADGSAGVRA